MWMKDWLTGGRCCHVAMSLGNMWVLVDIEASPVAAADQLVQGAPPF